MTNEQIERLAMDAACGEMSDDVRALFEAYLNEHPEYQKTATAMNGICERCATGFVSEMNTDWSLSCNTKKRLFAGGWLPHCARAAVLMAAVLLGMRIGQFGRERIIEKPAANAKPIEMRTDDPSGSPAAGGVLAGKGGFFDETKALGGRYEHAGERDILGALPKGVNRC